MIISLLMLDCCWSQNQIETSSIKIVKKQTNKQQQQKNKNKHKPQTNDKTNKQTKTTTTNKKTKTKQTNKHQNSSDLLIIFLLTNDSDGILVSKIRQFYFFLRLTPAYRHTKWRIRQRWLLHWVSPTQLYS